MSNNILIKRSEVKSLIEKLSDFYGYDLEFLKSYNFYLRNNGKVYITRIDINSSNIDRINSFGLYFGTFHDEERFRLSFEGSRFIKPTKNYVKLNDVSFKSYITAENLFRDEVEEINWEDHCPFLIVIYNEENLGCVSPKDKMFLNYLAKSRKLDHNRVF